MEQKGMVVEVIDGKAIVAIRRHDVCGKCGGCGAVISGAGENHIETNNFVNAVVGNTVRIGMDTSHVLKASFVVYIVPIMALLLGIWLGQQLTGVVGTFARFDIVLGLVFLLASYFIVRGYDRKMTDGKARATILEIVDEPDAVPSDEKC